MHPRRLATYLNDRLALLTAGVELAGRAVASNGGTAYGPLLERIAADFEEDRALLTTLMAAHAVKPDRLKRGVAWMGEKLGRLKFNDQLKGYSPLSRVVELDGLTAIVSVLRGSWAALEEVLPGEPEALIAAQKRARRNLDELDSLRPDAVREAVG